DSQGAATWRGSANCLVAELSIRESRVSSSVGEAFNVRVSPDVECDSAPGFVWSLWTIPATSWELRSAFLAAKSLVRDSISLDKEEQLLCNLSTECSRYCSLLL